MDALSSAIMTLSMQNWMIYAGVRDCAGSPRGTIQRRGTQYRRRWWFGLLTAGTQRSEKEARSWSQVSAARVSYRRSMSGTR
jgi:hypothetical protein